jgi:hypothetical protein
MVKYGAELNIIKRLALDKFDKSIEFLVVCGSLGRGDLKKSWSDIDLFLVLKKVDLESLQKVANLEKSISAKLKRETDIAVLSRLEFFETDVQNLPDKFRNYIYFIDQEQILIGNPKKIRSITNSEFLKNSKLYILDYHRRLKRIIIDKINDKSKKKQLLKKMIKFFILLLRKTVADKDFQPNTFIDAIEYAEKKKVPMKFDKVRLLEKVRREELLPTLTNKQTAEHIKCTYEAITDLTNYYIKNI